MQYSKRFCDRFKKSSVSKQKICVNLMTNTTFIASHEDMYSFCSSRNPDNERLLKKQCLRRPITVTTCYRGFRDEPKERLRKRMLHIGHKLLSLCPICENLKLLTAELNNQF